MFPYAWHWTYLASGLVVVKAVLALLHSGALGLALHVGLHTDRSVDLGFDGEIARFGELARSSRRPRWLRGGVSNCYA